MMTAANHPEQIKAARRVSPVGSASAMTAYRDTLMSRFGGLLYSGSHQPDSIACALEVASIARGQVWSDNPLVAGLPDLRRLNDAMWSSNQARTQALVPVIEAYWDWPVWSRARRLTVLTRLAELTIRRVVPVALQAVGLGVEAERCEREGTSLAAAYAATAAYAAYTTGDAAYAAAKVAAYAATAAGGDAAVKVAADTLLKIACQCWIEAAS